ncbi:MAG: hypothetical protein Q8S96_15250 [Hydrogenophaga sp.]|uniref:hypothetical protein n=1 Tax=Hydrogenophaga sp. TaxID=1904254 RepID=UPI002725B248|nr:hypothetical protein [Hydrogenophaga sp.]MDO9481724.1 hypothetical protein [Hydrogenophaga sp.]MDP3345791.1 hypothetical protein [Hydrogenophaga sp.]MDP3805087.1 hypothetical protein [Hydrogenophaga sp.]MDP3921889.1 hypothetical protein [Hydrogenophaga sp.]
MTQFSLNQPVTTPTRRDFQSRMAKVAKHPTPPGIKPKPQTNEARSPMPETGNGFLNGISGE